MGGGRQRGDKWSAAALVAVALARHAHTMQSWCCIALEVEQVSWPCLKSVAFVHVNDTCVISSRVTATRYVPAAARQQANAEWYSLGWAAGATPPRCREFKAQQHRVAA